MALTFGEARSYLAEYAGKGGKCESSEDVRRFVHEVLQYMLISGQHGGQRTYTFNAHKGCITLPQELEVPLKVKMGTTLGQVWDQWFEYNVSAVWEDGDDRCHNARNALKELPDDYCTVYDLPDGGSQVGIQCDCAQDADAHVIIHGVDLYGREVYTTHKGEKICGEYLGIKKGTLTTSSTVFAKITSVYKSQTSGYAQLFWINNTCNLKGFLAEYGPYEKAPSYRRYQLQLRCSSFQKIEILGRIRLKPYYADTEKIPFTNIVALKSAGQARNAQNNDDMGVAQGKEQLMDKVIALENNYMKPNVSQPISVYHPTSAGSVLGIINQRLSTRRWGRGWGFGRGIR